MRGFNSVTDEQIRARNTAALNDYFRLLEALDIDTWIDLWAADCEVTAPYAPDSVAATVQGRDRLYAFYTAEAAKYVRLRYPATEIHPLHDPNRFLARWFPHGELVDGGTYRNENVGIFEFDDTGLIRRFVEYFNPTPLL
ncbi:nuclear transport factor 2 family protein [Streptomyces mirabilis]